MNRKPTELMHSREEIDRIFVRYVGPIAPDLCEEILAQMTQGNRPAGAIRYVHLLSQNIPDPQQRLLFYEEASEWVFSEP
ncbi:MAG: hypothetical protein ACR2RB_17585 [Gammaproteobacteria bacterium]